MVLTNYRGITHREIEFPDRGVVIVSGANEIGKSGPRSPPKYPPVLIDSSTASDSTSAARPS
jgi:hypothetical protein